MQQLANENTATGIEHVGSELLRHIEEVKNEKKKGINADLMQAVKERDRAAEERERAIRERDEARKERDRAVNKVRIVCLSVCLSV